MKHMIINFGMVNGVGILKVHKKHCFLQTCVLEGMYFQ